MKNSRRRFLRLAGVSALGLGLGTKSALHANEENVESKAIKSAKAAEAESVPAIAEIQQQPLPKTAKQWGMVIDTRKFHSADDLKPITEACIKAHNVPRINNKNHEIKWIWDEHYESTFTDLKNKYISEDIKHRSIPVLCNHCEKPSCVRACPTQATFKRDDGIVLMDFHRCIGCRFCMAACPYGARSFNYIDPRGSISEEDFNREFPTRMMGVVEKCNFCAELIAKGERPACVEASKGAIVFGDLDDENSDVRKVLSSNLTIRRKPSLGTEPSVYYIL